MEDLRFSDAVNEAIWTDSPGRQDALRAAWDHGRLDVLQARTPGLAWVPDLVGRRATEPGAVVVVGSAYSPFVEGLAGRDRVMPLADYRAARDAGAFQRSFVRHVVEGDASYYGPILALLDAVGRREGRFVLLDLVRACVMEAATGKGGDGAVKADPALFMAYAAAGWDWTLRRLLEGEDQVVVALGTVAEHGLLRLMAEAGFRAHVSGRPAEVFQATTRPVSQYASSRSLTAWRERGQWWEVEGRVNGRSRSWRVLPVVHPAWVSRYDAGYRVSQEVLRAALST